MEALDIRFKGKRVDNNNQIQGYLFKICEKTYLLWGTNNGVPNMVEVYPSSVEQIKPETHIYAPMKQDEVKGDKYH